MGSIAPVTSQTENHPFPSQITLLHSRLLRAESLQSEIDRNLEYVESQQRELDELLGDYERQVRDALEGQGTGAQGWSGSWVSRDKFVVGAVGG
jgi:hypothetical protein